MKNNIVYEECMKILNSNNFKNEVRIFIKPLLEYILKEISIYLYFFIFFILVSFLLNLGVLILLIRYNNKINKI